MFSESWENEPNKANNEKIYGIFCFPLKRLQLLYVLFFVKWVGSFFLINGTFTLFLMVMVSYAFSLYCLCDLFNQFTIFMQVGGILLIAILQR